MKKIFTLLILLLNIYSNAIVTDKEIEYIEENWYTDNPKKQITPLNFKTKNFDITTEIIKYNYVPLWQDEDSDTLPNRIPENNQIIGYLNFNGTKKLFYNDDYSYAEYQAFEQIVCDKKDYINLIFVQIELDSEIRFNAMNFYPYIYEMKKENDKYTIVDVSDTYNELLNVPPNAISFNLSYSTPRYPYYDKEKIIERLIETGFCKKNEIVEGVPVNIENNLKIFSLDNLIEKIKNKKIVIDTYYIVNSFLKYPLDNKTLQQYNDIAYYLEQANYNDEAIFLLEKIIEKYPNRTVAYINLGDAYMNKKNEEKAIEYYKIYVQQMKEKKLDKKIPKRILDLINKSKPLSQNMQFKPKKEKEER